MRAMICVFAAFAAAGAAVAQPIPPAFFLDHEEFTLFNESEGKIVKGIETFEEGQLMPGEKWPFPNTLAPGIPNGPFPNGLAEPNIFIQSNVTPGPFPPQRNPSANPQALFAVGPGFLGANSVKVGEDEFLTGVHASLDLIFQPDDHTGIGFWLSRFQGYELAGWTIGVFDVNEVLLGTFPVPAPNAAEPTKTFFGVWSAVPIGRINIFDNAGPQPDAVDDIEMWIPAPGALPLLCAGFVFASRRRR